MSYTVLTKCLTVFYDGFVAKSEKYHFLASTNFAHTQNPASDRQKKQKRINS